MRTPPMQWNDKDKAFVNELLIAAFDCQTAACAAGNFPKVEEMQTFIGQVVMVGKLLYGYRVTPLKRIGGAKGVASNLKMTRNGVYWLLKEVELEHVDFCDSQVGWSDLILKSPKLSKIAHKLLHRPPQAKPRAKAKKLAALEPVG